MDFYDRAANRNVLRRAGGLERLKTSNVPRPSSGDKACQEPMQVITANRLDDGRVVYLTATGGWSVALTEARLLADASDTEAALALATAAVARQEILDPYPIGIVTSESEPVPASLRERIRAFGPSIPAGKA